MIKKNLVLDPTHFEYWKAPDPSAGGGEGGCSDGEKQIQNT